MKTPTTHLAVRGLIVLALASTLLAAPLTVPEQAAYQQGVVKAQGTVDTWLKAVGKSDFRAMHRAMLAVQRDPYAVKLMNELPVPLRRTFNGQVQSIQVKVKRLVRAGVARRFGVHPRDVMIKTFGTLPTGSKVGQDWDLTVYVNGKDVSYHDVEQLVWKAYYHAANGRVVAPGMTPAEFGKQHGITPTSALHPEAYPDPLLDPEGYAKVVRYKTDHVAQEAEMLRKLGQSSEAAHLRGEAVRQAVKQYDRNVKPLVREMGGQIHPEVEKGMRILRRVGKLMANGRRFTVADADALLAEMGQTTTGIINKAASQSEAAVKFGSRPKAFSRFLRGAGFVLMIYGGHQAAIAAGEEVAREERPGDSEVKTYGKYFVRTFGHATGITQAWRTGLAAGNEQMDVSMQDYLQRVEKGDNASFADLWLRAKVKGVGIGTFRLLKGMTWDVGWQAGLAMKSGFGLISDWQTVWRNKSQLEMQELAMFGRKAIGVWKQTKAANSRPLPADTEKALQELKALAAATAKDVAALALAQAMPYRIVVRTVDPEGRLLSDVVVKLDGARSLPTLGGSCVFQLVPAGPHGLATNAKGFAPASVTVTAADTPAAPIEVTLRLVPVPSALTVRVRDARGRPVPNATVVLEGRTPVVAGDGTCVFSDLMPGIYALRATAQGLEPSGRTVSVDPRKTSAPEAIIRMGDAPATLTVSVVDETGAPLPGANIGIDGEKHLVAGAGTLTFEKQIPGPHRVRAYAEGYGPEAETVILVPGERRTATLRLVPLPPPPDDTPPSPPPGGFTSAPQLLEYLGAPDGAVHTNGAAVFQTLWPRAERGPDGRPLPRAGRSGSRIDWRRPVPPRKNPRTLEELEAFRNAPPPVRCSVVAEVQTCRSPEEARGIFERAFDPAAAAPTLEKVREAGEQAKRTLRRQRAADERGSNEENTHPPGTAFAPEVSGVDGADDLEALTAPFPIIEIHRDTPRHLAVRHSSNVYIYGQTVHCKVGHRKKTVKRFGREVEMDLYRYRISSSCRVLGPRALSVVEEHYGRVGRFLIHIRLDLKHAFGRKITGGEPIAGAVGRRTPRVVRVIHKEAVAPAAWQRMRAAVLGLCAR